MPDSQSGEVTLLLRRLNSGEREVESKLFDLVYRELRRLGGHYMRSEREGHTLQPTALVHEAYTAIFGGQAIEFNNRAHFMAIASRAMRRVLVDHARARGARKRDFQRVTLDDGVPGTPTKLAELLAIHEALDEFAGTEPLQAQIVELRYFGGLSVEETAEALDISTRSVKRKWSLARLWLFDRLEGNSE